MEDYDLKESGPPDEHALQSTCIKPQARKLHDPHVTLEEYNYYAQKTREEEKHVESPKVNWRTLWSRKTKPDNAASQSNGQPKQIDLNLAKEENRLLISDEEWTDASRAYRSASWGAIFYLVRFPRTCTFQRRLPSAIAHIHQITTDILGPFAVPYSIGTLGYGPGIGLFTVFGVFAGYSGYLIWHVFVGVDSHEFPARNYGDLAFRTWGTIARHVVNFLQAIALLLLLGQVTILFGGNILELSKLRLCYIVCPLIFVIAGFFLTQIRTLKN